MIPASLSRQWQLLQTSIQVSSASFTSLHFTSACTHQIPPLPSPGFACLQGPQGLEGSVVRIFLRELFEFDSIYQKIAQWHA